MPPGSVMFRAVTLAASEVPKGPALAQHLYDPLAPDFYDPTASVRIVDELPTALAADARQLGRDPDDDGGHQGDHEGEPDDRRARRAVEDEPVGCLTEVGQHRLGDRQAAQPGQLQQRAEPPPPRCRHGGTLPTGPVAEVAT